MFFLGKKYDFKMVVSLIKSNDISSALKYMLDFTESEKMNSSNFELIGIQNTLKRIKDAHRNETIRYDTYNLHLNKIVNHLLDLNTEIDELDEKNRREKLYKIIKTVVGFTLLITLLILLKPFWLDKITTRNNGASNNENQKRQYAIQDFYINNGDCIDSIYAFIKIKNTGKKDLKNIRFKWTPDIKLPEEFLVDSIATLAYKETDSIRIFYKNRNNYKPGRYRSALEEDHPMPIFGKVFQNYETIACQKEALPTGLQKGDWVKISYVNKQEKITRLTEDSISFPINSTILNMEKTTD